MANFTKKLSSQQTVYIRTPDVSPSPSRRAPARLPHGFPPLHRGPGILGYALLPTPLLPLWKLWASFSWPQVNQ